MSIRDVQKTLCAKHSSSFIPADSSSILGIARDFTWEAWPVNGLRHYPEANTTGWYVWTGEYSTDKEFFLPTHVSHIEHQYPTLARYLGLAPGWRFLFDPTYEDVWFDEALLRV